MKKFLSLVLALVMTMSLVTISAGAKDFTDDSKINYDEAVAVLSAVKVIDGDTTGAFNPQGGLTRGAAAKIICNLILGPTTAGALNADAAPYKDVPVNSTYAGYIAYCSQQGIISGYADGTFRPAAPLTGYAFMKMLLGALGYDAKVEGYVGNNWSIAVAKRALAIGLNKGLADDFVGTKALTREEAALYAFNTLKATKVEYKNKSSIVVGDITVTTSAEATKVENGQTAPYTGYITSGGTNDQYVQFCEEYFSKLKLNVTEDAFGRPANNWVNNKTNVGTYSQTADATYEGKVTKATLYNLVGKTNVAKLTTATTFTAADDEFVLYVDGKSVATSTTVANWFANDNSSAAGGTIATINAVSGKGNTTEVYIDEGNNVRVVLVNTYVAQAAADYNANTKTLRINMPTNASKPSTSAGSVYTTKNLSIDDFEVDGFKKDDYVLYTAAWNSTTSKYEIKSIAAAEKVVGVVNSYTVGDSVTIDNTVYEYNKAISSSAVNGKNVLFSAGDKTTVVLDSYGHVIYVAEAITAADNWVYIDNCVAETALATKYIADAIFPDGSNKTITVKSYTNDKATDETMVSYTTNLHATSGTNGAVVKGWYTFTEADGEYKLYSNVTTNADGAASVTTSATANQKVLDNGVITVGIDVASGTASKANDNTVYIVKNTAKSFDVYTGVANAPTVKTSAATAMTAYYVNNTNTSFAKYVFVDASTTGAVTSAIADDSDMIYLLKKTGTSVDTAGKKFDTYDAVVDGAKGSVNIYETYTVDGAGTSVATANSDGGVYYNAKNNSYGYINALSTAATKANVTAVDSSLTNAEVKYSGGVLTLDGQDFIMADDAQVYLAAYSSSAPEIMNDKGKTYELTITDGEGLANALAGFKFTDGSFQVVYSGATASGKVAAIYIAVTDVTAV